MFSGSEGLIKAADMAMYEDKKERKLSAQEPILCVDNHSH
jgi:hypothetical protein